MDTYFKNPNNGEKECYEKRHWDIGDRMSTNNSTDCSEQ